MKSSQVYRYTNSLICSCTYLYQGMLEINKCVLDSLKY